MDVNATSNCFITIIHHQQKIFKSSQNASLNPAKKELERLIKTILDGINKIFEATKIDQWKDTEVQFNGSNRYEIDFCLNSLSLI